MTFAFEFEVKAQAIASCFQINKPASCFAV